MHPTVRAHSCALPKCSFLHDMNFRLPGKVTERLGFTMRYQSRPSWQRAQEEAWSAAPCPTASPPRLPPVQVSTQRKRGLQNCWRYQPVLPTGPGLKA